MARRAEVVRLGNANIIKRIGEYLLIIRTHFEHMISPGPGKIITDLPNLGVASLLLKRNRTVKRNRVRDAGENDDRFGRIEVQQESNRCPLLTDTKDICLVASEVRHQRSGYQPPRATLKGINTSGEWCLKAVEGIGGKYVFEVVQDELKLVRTQGAVRNQLMVVASNILIIVADAGHIVTKAGQIQSVTNVVVIR